MFKIKGETSNRGNIKERTDYCCTDHICWL